MRRGLLATLVVLGWLLQLGLLPALRPFGVVPNVALVLVVLLGLETTASTALIVAVIGGLVLDVASGANFGLWMGILVLAALSGGLVTRAGVELAGGLMAAMMVAVGTIVMAMVILVGVAGSVAHWPWLELAGGLVMQLVLNLVLTILVRPLVRRLVPAAVRPVL